MPSRLPVATDEDWAAISVPSGWEPIARACRTFSDRLPEFCERVAHEVSDGVPEFRAPAVKISSTAWVVHSMVQPALFGMAENRGPLPHETEIGANFGRLRARIGGLPDAMPRGFQIAFKAFMQELSVLVDEREPGLLFESVTTLWMWLHEMSDAAARGFRDEAAALAAEDADTRERFVAALRRGEVSTDAVRQLAEVLGFDPSGSFRVLRLRANFDASVVHSAVRNIAGGSQSLVHGSDVLIITQGVPLEVLEAAAYSIAPSSPVGIGMERAGLEGARTSLIDADWSLGLAEVSGTTVRFEEDWLLATLWSRREQLTGLLDRGVQIQRTHPHLTEAVRAFGANGFSQSAAARALHLRHNSLAYRLHRWREMAGYDPSTPEGVIYAMLAALMTTNEADR